MQHKTVLGLENTQYLARRKPIIFNWAILCYGVEDFSRIRYGHFPPENNFTLYCYVKLGKKSLKEQIGMGLTMLELLVSL